MNKKDRERALDFEKIRKKKVSARRRKLALIIGAAVLAIGAAVIVLVMQILQVTADDRNFWGNFNASHAQQGED